jgi:hypothetical protein
VSGIQLAAGLEVRRQRALEDGSTPLALLDIDLTLVDNAERNRAIWRDWMLSMDGVFPDAAARAEQARTMPIVFGVQENMATLGVEDPERQREGLRYWLKAFFSDAYTRLDEPLEGAVAAVRAIHEAGVTIAYVTARPESMAPVTVACFEAMGFPIGVAGTILTMRPRAAGSDDEAKSDACAWLGTLGTPILAADNEPGHVNAMHARFPEALSVLVDTRHSGGAPALASGITRVPRLLDAVAENP